MSQTATRTRSSLPHIRQRRMARIEDAARTGGWMMDMFRITSGGSVYYQFSRDSDRITIRLSDHRGNALPGVTGEFVSVRDTASDEGVKAIERRMTNA